MSEPIYELTLRVPLSEHRRAVVAEEALDLAMSLDGSFSIRKLGVADGRCSRFGGVALVDDLGSRSCFDCGPILAGAA